MRVDTSSKVELLSELRSTQEKNKLNDENKSLDDRLFTLEDGMKEIINMKEFFAAQQSHNLHMTSLVSTEWPLTFFADQELIMIIDVPDVMVSLLHVVMQSVQVDYPPSQSIHFEI
uniref:Uncharacterized protein n=1 Tax=Solanum lycopersicum TaxID=4081 RepID=A0A3Q7GGI9_SOLLC